MRKTLVLSIDSGCWEYIDPLLAAGRMPNVARLIERGARGVLESTMPPITPVAFSSFLTGVNPGKHGIFDWSLRREDGRGGMVNAGALKAPPFWTYLNQHRVRVGLFNVPLTYPPQPIDGFIVPGIPVPRTARRFTYPPEALDRIEERFGPYRVDVPRDLLTEGVDAYVQAWIEYETMQTEAAMALAEAYGVDLLVFNYASLDRVNHFAPGMEHIAQVLVNVDTQIGRWMERFPEANFVLMSDHGSRRIRTAFLLGPWLVQHGYAAYGEHSLDIPPHEANFALARFLREKGMQGRKEKLVRAGLRLLLRGMPAPLRRRFWERAYRSAPEALAYRFTERLDWARTKVFAMSNSGPLLINTGAGDGRGAVGPDEYERIRDALIRDLLSVRDPQGRPVFSRVYRREEIYHGPALADAPDLIADHYESDCDIVVDNKPGLFCFVDRLGRFGDHSRRGILVASGPDFASRPPSDPVYASILDLPATLLHLYGAPLPRDWDGQVLRNLLATPLAEREVVYADTTAPETGTPGEGYSADEEVQVMEHLRDLGYL
ncbi:MAG TPA: hypothetical protein ENK08_03485 [Chloroflexi bacterium]|nr:hypothetical protein [Chloroflexota bacterium]